MGICISLPGHAVSEKDKQLHREAERELKETKVKFDHTLKVLLLGAGDSGKSTVLKQMRLIHHVPFTAREIELFRQLVFSNLAQGLRSTLEAMDDMELRLHKDNERFLDFVRDAPDIKDGQPYPQEYKEPFVALWKDANFRMAIQRGNEAALPDNIPYLFNQLDRLFSPDFIPTEQDIVHTRARTIGITETLFNFDEKELLVVDVGGQKSERRKWIHCFQDVTTILFLASLSGFNQCLVEDKDANQMQDAMTIFDSICSSQWFKNTSIILFLNKNDLFEAKLATSDIQHFFPDYDGPPNDVKAGREYFKHRFARLAAKTGRSKDREVYIHYTTATDAKMLRAVISAVEDTILRNSLNKTLMI